MIGPTGSGKSSTVNNLLEDMQGRRQEERAEVGKSGESCTKVPKVYMGYMCGRMVNLIDTPGLNDTAGLTNEAVVSSVLYQVCMDTASKTVDCFLITDSLNNDRSMTDRIMKAIK